MSTVSATTAARSRRVVVQRLSQSPMRVGRDAVLDGLAEDVDEPPVGDHGGPPCTSGVLDT
jgi:hypothetical protein